MRHLKAALFALLALLPGAALAQSNPGWTYGYVPPVAIWNAEWASKQDYLGAPPILTTGGIMTGELTTAPATASRSGLNISPGVTPTSPVNGDVWDTSAGFFFQVNGSTVGPIGVGPCATCAVINATNTFAAEQIINMNATTLPTAITGAALNIGAANGVVGRIQLNAFGQPSTFSGVSYGGTNASPTAITSGTEVGSFNSWAYNGAGLTTTAIASYRIYAAENISSGHQGSQACVATTPIASATLANGLCQNASGGITIGAGLTDEGIGTLNLSGALYNANTAPTGTGAYVRAISPTFTGTITAASASFSGSNFITLGNLVQSTAGAQFLGVSGASTANYAPFTLASLANLASPSPTLDLIPITDHTTGTIKNVTPAAIAGSVVSGVATLNSQTGNLVGWTPPQGRLSLSTAAVMTASVAGATAINYVAYTGHNVPIYNGTAVVQAQICAANTVGNCLLSVTLGSNWLASTFYDWLIAWNGGTPTLCSVAWTNSTTRATALTPIDGLNTNASSFTCATGNSTSITVPANQGTYVGTCETGLAGQFNHIYGGTSAGGTAAFIGCWNAFNRIQQRTIVSDTTVSWTYAVALTWRAANAGLPAHLQGTFVRGLAEDSLVGTYYGFSQPGAGSASAIGVGLDSTTTPCGITMPATQASVNQAITASCTSIPGIGAHVMAALEWNFNTTAGTFYGLPNAGGQTGLEMVFSY
jgi:hypothetical protein